MTLAVVPTTLIPVTDSFAIRSVPLRLVVSACPIVTVSVPPSPPEAATEADSVRVRVDSSMVSVAPVNEIVCPATGRWNGMAGAFTLTVNFDPVRVPVRGPDPTFTFSAVRKLRAAADGENDELTAVVPDGVAVVAAAATWDADGVGAGAFDGLADVEPAAVTVFADGVGTDAVVDAVVVRGLLVGAGELPITEVVTAGFDCAGDVVGIVIGAGADVGADTTLGVGAAVVVVATVGLAAVVSANAGAAGARQMVAAAETVSRPSRPRRARARAPARPVLR